MTGWYVLYNQCIKELDGGFFSNCFLRIDDCIMEKKVQICVLLDFWSYKWYFLFNTRYIYIYIYIFSIAITF